jgi:hypothetical protein
MDGTRVLAQVVSGIRTPANVDVRIVMGPSSLGAAAALSGVVQEAYLSRPLASVICPDHR